MHFKQKSRSNQVAFFELCERDYIMCYWQASNNFAWLIERGEQLMLFVVLGMVHLEMRHWAYTDRSQVDVVRNVVSCMGFTREVPVYAPYRNSREILTNLESDISIFQENVKQQIEKQRKQEEKANDVNKSETPKANISESEAPTA